jgi:hypothetical protein
MTDLRIDPSAAIAELAKRGHDSLSTTSQISDGDIGLPSPRLGPEHRFDDVSAWYYDVLCRSSRGDRNARSCDSVALMNSVA